MRRVQANITPDSRVLHSQALQVRRANGLLRSFFSFFLLFSAGIVFLLSTNAWASVQSLKTDANPVRVGQEFRVQVHVKTSWLDPEQCRWIIRQDGVVVSDREKAPLFERSRLAWTMRNLHGMGISWQSGEIDDDRFHFDWVFYTPGPHRLSIVKDGSSCPIERDVELVVDVANDYSALSWYMLARPEKAVTKKLNGDYFYHGKQSRVRLMIDASLKARSERSYNKLDPQGWKAVNQQVLAPFLKTVNVNEFEVVDVEDIQEWIRNWDDRSPESRFLILSGEQIEQVRSLLNSGEMVAVGNVNANKIAQYYQNRDKEVAEKKANDANQTAQRNQQAQQAIQNTQTGIVAIRQVAALQKDVLARICSKRGHIYDGSLIEAYRWMADFSTWSRAPRAKGFDDIYDDLDELFTQFKKGQCHSVVMTVVDSKTVLAALQRDQFPFELFEVREEAALLASFKDRYEYQSLEDAKLALKLAPHVEPDEAARLRKSGIQTQQDFDQAVKRMVASSYDTNTRYRTVASFLEDEAAAKPKKVSPIDIRQAREKIAAAKAAAEREKYVKSYPYQAILTCSHGSYSNLPVYMCVIGKSTESQVLLQNCGHIRRLDYTTLSSDSVQIELCPSYEIKAQNVSEWTLQLVIKDNRSGKVLSQQFAPRFRIVHAKN